MPKVYPAKILLKWLIKRGFKEVSQKGSHKKLKDIFGHVVIVPVHAKDIPYGTFLSILEQAHISIEEAKQNL